MIQTKNNWERIITFRQYINDLERLELEAWRRYNDTHDIGDGVRAYDYQTRKHEAHRIYSMLYGELRTDVYTEEMARSRNGKAQSETGDGIIPISEDRRSFTL